MVNRRIVSDILGREVSEGEMQYIYEDWKAFHDDPVRFIGTAVVQCVNQYLDELKAVAERNRQYTGAQSVEEEEIINALEQGMMLLNEAEDRYVTEENMAGGKYCCWAKNEFGCAPAKLTDSITEAMAFVQ